MRVIEGDCLSVMPTLDAESVDAVICDPPYGLKFMGKEWDHGIPGVPFWIEALRVAKPGAYLLAFGGTRTHHRLMVAIEDAGWEIRDCLMFLYGSGFPKSLDVSKAIDKKRDDRMDALAVVDFLRDAVREKGLSAEQLDGLLGAAHKARNYLRRDLRRSPPWDEWLVLKTLLGFGPEMDAEVWRLNGRKGTPGEAWNEREIVGSKAVTRDFRGRDFVGSQSNATEVLITTPVTDAAKQWEGWGTALKPAWEPIILARKPISGTVASNVQEHGAGALNIEGCRIGDRWPANVALDQESATMVGAPSRFFYTAKASRSERGEGNNHPTVKPLDLMQWLCRLVTPKGGLILDPFCGSGTTGRAAIAEGFSFIGIELSPEYAALARARIAEYAPLFGDVA